MRSYYSTMGRGNPDSMLALRYSKNMGRREFLSNKIRDGTATQDEKNEYRELVYEQIALSGKIVQK